MSLRTNRITSENLYSGVRIKNLLKTEFSLKDESEAKNHLFYDFGEGTFASWNNCLNNRNKTDCFQMNKIEQSIKSKEEKLSDIILEHNLLKWRREIDATLLRLKKKGYKV